MCKKMNTNPSTRIHFLTFLIGLGQLYAWATTYYIPATLVQLVADQTGHSSLAIVGGFSWALLMGGLFAPKIGTWIEHEGGRRPLATGSLLMGIGLLLLACTQGLIVWYSGWTFIGVGMALGLFNAAFATLGRLLGQGAKAVIVRVTLISGFATLLWPLTTYLNAHVGWRWMVIIYAIPHLFVWVPLYLFGIPAQVPDHAEEQTSPQQVYPEKIKLVFYLLATYAILRSIVGTTVSVNILMMFQGIGLTLTAAALIAALIGPAQIGGRIIEMSVGKNFDPINSSIFWTAVLPASIFTLLAAGPSASSVFAIAYGMSNGVLSITMGILPMILFGAKGYAKLLGKLAMPVLIAQALTPLVVDPLLESLPSITIFALAGLLGTFALICLSLLAYISRRSN